MNGFNKDFVSEIDIFFNENMITIDVTTEKVIAKSCCSSPIIILVILPTMNPANTEKQVMITYL